MEEEGVAGLLGIFLRASGRADVLKKESATISACNTYLPTYGLRLYLDTLAKGTTSQLLDNSM